MKFYQEFFQWFLQVVLEKFFQDSKFSTGSLSEVILEFSQKITIRIRKWIPDGICKEIPGRLSKGFLSEIISGYAWEKLLEISTEILEKKNLWNFCRNSGSTFKETLLETFLEKCLLKPVKKFRKKSLEYVCRNCETKYYWNSCRNSTKQTWEIPRVFWRNPGKNSWT